MFKPNSIILESKQSRSYFAWHEWGERKREWQNKTKCLKCLEKRGGKNNHKTCSHKIQIPLPCLPQSLLCHHKWKSAYRKSTNISTMSAPTLLLYFWYPFGSLCISEKETEKVLSLLQNGQSTFQRDWKSHSNSCKVFFFRYSMSKSPSVSIKYL